jgi:hypothetical protein
LYYACCKKTLNFGLSEIANVDCESSLFVKIIGVC